MEEPIMSLFDSDLDKKTSDVIWSAEMHDEEFFKIDALFTLEEINKIRKALGFAKISTGSFG